jgi:hypothetical protein
MRAVSLIEPLEDRIAPASVTFSPSGKVATYTDATGDTVQVTTSKGVFSSSQFIISSGNLTELSLTGDSAFNGANIVFTVFPIVNPGSPQSSTLVNVGYIDAIGLSLGSVTIPGDLGHIDVGDGPTALALGKLTVTSLGANSSTTGTSNITGGVEAINVAGNIEGTLYVQDFGSHSGTGNIGQLNVGGSINGGASSVGPGDVFFTGMLANAVIGGGIEGGSAAYSGSIGGYDSITGGLGTFSRIGSVTVKGSVPDDPNPSPLPGVPGTSILGGSGAESGAIVAASVGSVNIAGDVYGGTGTASGAIQGGLSVAKVNIQGSLIGGNFTTGSPSEANLAGLVFGGKIGSVLVGGTVYGGSGLNSGQVLSLGAIQKVVVMGDVIGGTAGVAASSGGSATPGSSGAINGKSLGSVVIEGSLTGGNFVQGDTNQTGNNDGVIVSGTSIGSVYIGQNVDGGSGPNSGQIATQTGGVGSLVIAGSVVVAGSPPPGIVGGAGDSSGEVIIAGPVGKLMVAKNLTGGSGASSGSISINGAVSSLAIGGNVTGGTADNTATISVFGTLKTATIAGNVEGSSSGATKLTNTGYIQANNIGTMVIGGDLISGTAGSGGLDTSGAIRATNEIGSITLGGITGNSTNPAVISAVGPATVTAKSATDVAIGNITIGGTGGGSSTTVALYADILAGYSTNTSAADPLGTGVNASAQIGTVQINGSIEATNIIAGVAGVGTGTPVFGTAGSAALSGTGVTDYSTILSKISQVIVTGYAVPTGTPTDTFGIAGETIVKASVGGASIPLNAGPNNDVFPFNDHLLSTGTSAAGDTFLYEV